MMLETIKECKTEKNPRRRAQELVKGAKPSFLYPVSSRWISNNWYRAELTPCLSVPGSSLLSGSHQSLLVCKQGEVVQAAATLNDMHGLSEMHAQDGFLNPLELEQQREFQGDR